MYDIDMQVEIWKDICGYEGLYQCSNWGRIKSLRYNKEKILMPGKCNKSGRLTVLLYNNGKNKTRFVHRLVLEAFVGPCPPGMECRHLDGNPSNNRLDNLKWGTKSENQLDRRRHKTDNSGERHGMSKLNEWQVRIIKRLFEIPDMTDREIGEIFGVSSKTINDIRLGKTWKHI